MTIISQIHAARSRLGIEVEDARAIYHRVTGKSRLTEMSPDEQARVRDELNSRKGTRAKGLTGPYAKKLQALWIAGWNLGVFADRTDAALLAFCRRQTGIENTRFLRDADDARAVIEALKSWIAREGRVDWTKAGQRDHRTDQDRIIAAQLLILKRQSPGESAPGLRTTGKGVLEKDRRAAKQDLMNLLGRRIRATGSKAVA